MNSSVFCSLHQGPLCLPLLELQPDLQAPVTTLTPRDLLPNGPLRCVQGGNITDRPHNTDPSAVQVSTDEHWTCPSPAPPPLPQNLPTSPPLLLTPTPPFPPRGQVSPAHDLRPVCA
ncbi:hypothetical protein L211DRAFT_101068 [Terfezia boudieri ATCC MYA-4762]|uniref:Uncharacterized protein n=1 Tax=Terfezia boudieri ATCC MYA-4762 TaxID=1051890 RepID=A0A3N4LQR9_9PEZI|nr:hypothetical protein L211DRAFT_101068 [Terfezia boudieri ATCC MYA-4762]